MTTIEILSELRSNYNCFDESEEPVYRALSEAIEALKQPERKKGKWITEPYDLENDIWAHRCGECLKVSMLGSNGIKFNFCPNCGSFNGGDADVNE